MLVDNSRAAIQWLIDNGARFALSFNRQAFEVNGKFKFWGGMVMSMIGESARLSTINLDLLTVCRAGQRAL